MQQAAHNFTFPLHAESLVECTARSSSMAPHCLLQTDCVPSSAAGMACFSNCPTAQDFWPGKCSLRGAGHARATPDRFRTQPPLPVQSSIPLELQCRTIALEQQPLMSFSIQSCFVLYNFDCPVQSSIPHELQCCSVALLLTMLTALRRAAAPY